MPRRTRTWLTPIAGLIMVAASLATVSSAQAATRSVQAAATPSRDIVTLHSLQAAAESPQAAATPSTGNCLAIFEIYSWNTGYFGYIASDGNLHFDANGSDPFGTGTFDPQVFCQSRIASGSSLVAIFTTPSGECLSINATAKTVSNHNANGCSTGTVQYLVWKFISLQTQVGPGFYAVQNQYDASGRPCMFNDDWAQPTTFASCSRIGSDGNLSFGYVKVGSGVF
jgi:hypothetical protein